MNRLIGFAVFMATLANAQFAPKAYFLSKTIIIPHDEKKHRGGEDAAAADEYTLIVADGVGGWGNYGIDPGLFSKSLVSKVLKRNQERPTEHIRTVVFIGNE